MAFKHGKGSELFLNEFRLSAYVTNSDLSADQDNPVTTTYQNNGVRRQVVGLKDGTINIATLHDAQAGGSHPVLTGIYGASAAAVVTRALEGTTIGLPAEMISGRLKNLKEGDPVDGVITTTADVESDGDNGIDFGKWHHALAAETVTGNSASVDNGASTSNGGVAHIHCTTVSGSTPTLDARIQDSPDDSVFTDKIVFAQLTAAGKERATASGTVNRYTRNRHVIGGSSPSFTFADAFARR